MTRILHFSDTHFGTERKAVVEAALDLAAAQAPDLVVLSGDITQRARRRQFAAARAFIERLSLPVLAVPGNHDIPLFNVFARALNPYGNYKRALGAVLEPVFENPGLLAIGVNTTRPRRRKDGEISEAQIARAQRLRQARPGNCGWWWRIIRCGPRSSPTCTTCCSGASARWRPGPRPAWT